MKLTDLIENQEGMGPRRGSRYTQWLFGVKGMKPLKANKSSPYALNVYLPDESSTGFDDDMDALAAAPTNHDSHWQVVDTTSDEVLHEPEWWYQYHWLNRRQAAQ